MPFAGIILFSEVTFVSVARKLVKTPLGIIQYLWLDGGLVPYDLLRAEWLEDGRRNKKWAISVAPPGSSTTVSSSA
jgi:hypothetical protein